MSLSWVVLEKDGQQYKYAMFENSHIFNRDLMDIQIEGWNMDVFLTYDDIVCIKTENYDSPERRIEQLPLKLSELHIRFSNITELPVFPPNIQKIQLYETGVVLNEEQMTELHNLFPNVIIAISSVHKMKAQKPIVPYYRYTMPTYVEYDSDDVYTQYSYDGSDDDDDDDYNGEEFYDEYHVLDNTQTVHLTSINKSVSQSIEIIRKEYEKHPQVLTPFQLLFREENQQDTDTVLLKDAIQEWRENPSRVYGLTFSSLFTMVMTIIGGQPDEETQRNMKQRVLSEMRDAMDKCFMGRINRLVSSLVGFVKGVSVHLSVKEEVQMKSLLIVKALTDQTINKEEAREQMNTLLKEFNEEEGITEQIKQGYLSALEDLL